jgi:hypothetical protein
VAAISCLDNTGVSDSTCGCPAAGCETAHVPVPLYEASLRVFSPLSTFPPGERRRWERYVAAGKAPDRLGLQRIEHETALAAAVRPTLDVDEEHALVEVVDGVTYLCPARTQLRVWQAAEEFREGLAALLADTFVPRGLAEEAADQLAGWREVSPDLRAHVRTSTWSVPLTWFLLFDPAEALRGEGTLRYSTGIAAARRRSADALRVLEATLPQGPATPELADLVSWLTGFHGYSRVELDYGLLATLFGDDLEQEVSVDDLGAGLAALARGDGLGAGRAYERVMERWRSVQQREHSS